MGMVPRGGAGGLKKQSTLDEVYDPAANKCHCNDRSCTMWWTTEFRKGTFCAVCDKSVRKVALDARTLPGFRRFF
jgi:hypothetical protein